MSIADPNSSDPDGPEPVHPPEPEGRRTLDGGELLADHLFASRSRPRSLLEKRADGTAWRIYSDNIAMARWLQSTVQGMLNAELSDRTIPCAEAQFSKAGDPRYYWTEHIKSHGEEISPTLFDIGEPLHLHSQPNQISDPRYGVCTVLIPALGTRLVRNGVEAEGRSWPRRREKEPSSTSALTSRKAGRRWFLSEAFA